MDTPNLFPRAARVFVAAIAAMLVFVPGIGRAAQLTLAPSPLFLTVPVPSNIFFLDDDSGSMDWDMLTNEGKSSVSVWADGVMTLNAGGKNMVYTYIYPFTSNTFTPDQDCGSNLSICPLAHVLPDESAVAGTSNMPADKHGVWRGRYYGYNKMYYNPDVNYLPWPGVDSAGNVLPDAKAPSTEPSYISAFPTIRWNPYSATSPTVNITTGMTWTSYQVPTTTGSLVPVYNNNIYPARYYVCNATNCGDGVVDSTDAHTLYEIHASTDATCSSGATCPTSFTRASTRTDCTYVDASTRSCTQDQELKNFANWFMYHRRHQQAAKYAIGKVIDQAQSEVRMGHATINNNGGGVSRALVQPMTGSWTTGNKKAILDALYKVQSNSYTPLRTALDQTGKYFECVSGNIFGLSAGSSSCPILPAASGGACQQNFTVLVTDGFWSDSDPYTGAGNADGDASSDFDNKSPNIAYGDGASNTLADVAMRYYERDLAPGLSNQVPVTAGVDNATHQHMVTYGVAFGVTGSLSAGPPAPTVAFPWPDPTASGASDTTKIDDLRHAAYNGRGQFLSAQDPDTLASALLTTLGSIGDRTGSSASVAVNSRSLSTTTRLYQARFTSGEWSGDLRALTLDANGVVNTQPVWSAKDQVKNQDWNSGRAILTRNATIGIPFRWTTSGANALTATQQSNLSQDPVTSNNDSEGSNRLNWLRGDSSNEGTGAGFRTRTNGFKLGDIVNSSPIYVGTPIYLPDLEATPHSSFRSTYVSRREMVYAGANDGMLHGFEAATGQEKMAYIPSMVFPNLNQLTNPSYTHRYYVDGSPTTGDVYGTFTNVSGICSTGCWRTILAGGLAGGGKGVYALDVTDPNGSTVAGLALNESNAASIALWEYTDSASGDMGYIYGQPTIMKVRTGSSSTAWAVIFGNGYDSVNENAALYVVNAVTGALIRKIVLNPKYTGWGTTNPSNNSNGLSMPAVVDTDGDYVVEYVYAGDLRGNMWKVDLTDNNVNNWDSAYKQGSDPRPLYKAVDGSGNEQPITVQPEVGRHPDGQSGYMVYFGTGRYIASGDNAASTSPVHTFYGIWDKPYSSSGGTATGGPVTRGDLGAQTISDATVGSITVRTVTNYSIAWRTGSSGSCTFISGSPGTWSDCLGWRDDLMTASSSYAGEKSVSNPVLKGGTVPRIIFNPLIPQTDACTAGGTSPMVELNPKNGGQLPVQVFDVNEDGIIDSNDMIGGTVPVAGIYPGLGIMPEPTILRDSANKTDLKVETGSTGAVRAIKNYVSDTASGRQSWRQLK